MEIRRAQQSDSEGIRAIYNHEVLHSTVTFDLVARTVEEHARWMTNHSGAYPVIVSVDDDEVIGFAALSPYRPRPAYSTTVEDSVYVRSDHRSNGQGKKLLDEILLLAQQHGFHCVIARIAADHEASIALHLKCGFELIGIEREIGRKFGRWLDSAVMQKLL